MLKRETFMFQLMIRGILFPATTLVVPFYFLVADDGKIQHRKILRSNRNLSKSRLLLVTKRAEE